MRSVSATELKNKTADVMDLVAAERAVAIRRHDKPRAVLLSMEEYASLKGGEASLLLEELKAEYRHVLDDMQSPEQKAAAERAFNAPAEELSEAALRAAQRMIASGDIER